MDTRLIVSASPHLRSEETTTSLMANVIVALTPCVVASAIIFGWRALLVTAVSVVACVAFEWLYCKLLKKPSPIGDLSAVVTGIILALNVPVGMPLGQLIVGDLVAIVVVKQLFGGIGMNFANPALVGRIVLFISFAGSMNKWVYPDAAVDQLSSATPLAVADTSKLSLLDLFMGVHGGVLGETCALAIVLGLIYLVATKTISIAIPASYIGSMFVFYLISTGSLHGALVGILSGAPSCPWDLPPPQGPCCPPSSAVFCTAAIFPVFLTDKNLKIRVFPCRIKENLEQDGAVIPQIGILDDTFRHEDLARLCDFAKAVVHGVQVFAIVDRKVELFFQITVRLFPIMEPGAVQYNTFHRRLLEQLHKIPVMGSRIIDETIVGETDPFLVPVPSHVVDVTFLPHAVFPVRKRFFVVPEKIPADGFARRDFVEGSFLFPAQFLRLRLRDVIGRQALVRVDISRHMVLIRVCPALFHRHPDALFRRHHRALGHGCRGRGLAGRRCALFAAATQDYAQDEKQGRGKCQKFLQVKHLPFSVILIVPQVVFSRTCVL